MVPIKHKPALLLWLILPIAAGYLYPYVKPNPQHLEWFSSGLLLYVLFFSVVVHELCHGAAAYICGDHTAHNAGRLTFNPISHVDLFGTILLPLALHFLKSSVRLAWAKPVPFNPLNLRQHPRDQVFLAMAGPLSNFTLASLCFSLYLGTGVVFKLLYHQIPLPGRMAALVSSGIEAITPDLFNILAPLTLENIPFEAFWFVLFELLRLGMLMNLVLGTFNLIPFPPLDGFWILKALLPAKLVGLLGKLQTYGFILLLVALRFGLLDIFFSPAFIVLVLFYKVAVKVFTL